jgi:hypothetical protein
MVWCNIRHIVHPLSGKSYARAADTVVKVFGFPAGSKLLTTTGRSQSRNTRDSSPTTLQSA